MPKIDGCIDTNEDAGDNLDFVCQNYKMLLATDTNSKTLTTNLHYSSCGKRDDEDFKAKEMCCACGGGRYGISLNYYLNSNKV